MPIRVIWEYVPLEDTCYTNTSTHTMSMQVHIQYARKYACNTGTEPDPEGVSALGYCRKRMHLAVDQEFRDDRVVISFLAPHACDLSSS